MFSENENDQKYIFLSFPNQEVASTSFLEMPILVPETKIPSEMGLKPRYELFVHCLNCLDCFHHPHCLY